MGHPLPALFCFPLSALRRRCKGTAPFPTTDLVSDPVSDTSDSRKPALRPRRPNTFPAVCLSRCLPIREMFVPYLVVYRPPASESGSLSLFSSDPPLWQSETDFRECPYSRTEIPQRDRARPPWPMQTSFLTFPTVPTIPTIAEDTPRPEVADPPLVPAAPA